MSKCRLCKEPSTLIESHLIPRSAYKASKSFVSGGRAELVTVKTVEGSAAYSDVQVTKKLLCSKCEDLFSKKGEKIIGNCWATSSRFPLLDILNSSEPLAIGPEFSVYDTSLIDKRVLDALCYFAVSIFWRASIWDWGRERDQYVGALGPKYEEIFRGFLLGGEPLENVYMIISVNTSGNMNGLFSFPAANKLPGGKFHIFDILGIKFTAFVGGYIHKDILKPFVSSGSNVILISAPLENSRDFLELAKALQTKVTARGRLLKDHPQQ